MAKKKVAVASKPRKPKRDAEKKFGKKADMTEFRAQLDSLGLKIIEVTADGNCFFRAMSDQLEGNEEEHMKYRAMVVQYIKWKCLAPARLLGEMSNYSSLLLAQIRSMSGSAGLRGLPAG